MLFPQKCIAVNLRNKQRKDGFFIHGIKYKARGILRSSGQVTRIRRIIADFISENPSNSRHQCSILFILLLYLVKLTTMHESAAQGVAWNKNVRLSLSKPAVLNQFVASIRLRLLSDLILQHSATACAAEGIHQGK
jgi:hypothetical protein